jgi:hypothetical protein
MEEPESWGRPELPGIDEYNDTISMLSVGHVKPLAESALDLSLPAD